MMIDILPDGTAKVLPETKALPEPKTMTKKQAAIVVGVELALMGLMAWGKYRRYQRESTSR